MCMCRSADGVVGGVALACARRVATIVRFFLQVVLCIYVQELNCSCRAFLVLSSFLVFVDVGNCQNC